MPHVITRQCQGTCDTACVNVCPVDCIHGPIPLERIAAVPPEARAERLSGLQLFINPDECICCGACQDECPVSAIYEEELVPARYRDDIRRNAAFFGLAPGG